LKRIMIIILKLHDFLNGDFLSACRN